MVVVDSHDPLTWRKRSSAGRTSGSRSWKDAVIGPPYPAR
ncbi:hypothetical protein HMPREF9564_01553 [Cutibacterium acnes HL053PA1]|nr:hypothetical protein HMPREF9564_01553 [Cutibacterium acnes HL053PA1]